MYRVSFHTLRQHFEESVCASSFDTMTLLGCGVLRGGEATNPGSETSEVTALRTYWHVSERPRIHYYFAHRAS